MSEARMVTPAVVNRVEIYIEYELSHADKYENRTLLDESGISNLHRLASDIYGLGFRDGEQVAHIRERGVNARSPRK